MLTLATVGSRYRGNAFDADVKKVQASSCVANNKSIAARQNGPAFMVGWIVVYVLLLTHETSQSGSSINNCPSPNVRSSCY